MLRLLATASVVALLAAAPAFAQTSGSATGHGARHAATSSKSDLSKGDKTFVREAAQGGRAEVELGKMAQQKAQSQEVKQFGERMVQDHSAANEKLMSVASEKGIEPPKDIGKEHKEARDKLQKLSGSRFDREYMRAMVKDHEKDVKAFEKEAKSGKDADVKNFAQQTLPTLQEHLQMAQSIEKNMRSQPPMTSQRNGAAGTAGSSTHGTRQH